MSLSGHNEPGDGPFNRTAAGEPSPGPCQPVDTVR